MSANESLSQSKFGVYAQRSTFVMFDLAFQQFVKVDVSCCIGFTKSSLISSSFSTFWSMNLACKKSVSCNGTL